MRQNKVKPSHHAVSITADDYILLRALAAAGFRSVPMQLSKLIRDAAPTSPILPRPRTIDDLTPEELDAVEFEDD